MASPELDNVLEILRNNPPFHGDDVLAMRANLQAAVAVAPLPDGVHFEAVDAGGVPAEWSRAPDVAADRAIVYFHGGGYAMGSIESHRQLVANLSAASDAPVLNVSYRLGPEHPYPAAVEDAMAAYRFALSTGLDPTSVAIAGDSAGGGLTVACLVALRNAGDPLPAAGVCISPWFDLTLTSESMRSKADVDPMVDHRKLSMLAEAYLAGTDPKTPTASPLFADLTDLPPLLVHVGTREVLLDDSTRFCERARSAGVDVELAIWEEMFHVWHAFADLLPEGHEAIDEIGGYLTRRFT